MRKKCSWIRNLRAPELPVLDAPGLGLKCIPRLARGEDLAQAEWEKKPGTCQAQVAQHHHISIFIECCRLSNVKSCCYLRMCRFSTNADMLAPYENSFNPFHYFLHNQSKVFKSLSSFSFSHNKDGFFFLQCTKFQATHPKSAAFWGYCFLGLGGLELPRAITTSYNLGCSHIY